MGDNADTRNYFYDYLVINRESNLDKLHSAGESILMYMAPYADPRLEKFFALLPMLLLCLITSIGHLIGDNRKYLICRRESACLPIRIVERRLMITLNYRINSRSKVMQR